MDIRRRALLSKTLHEGGSSEGSINIDNYLTIEALEDGLTASLSKNACEYCVDGDGNWKSLAAGTATESVNSGQTLSFRGNLTPVINKGIGTFTISKKCNLKGNCMSMLFGDSAVDNFSLSGKDHAFYKLFYNCKNIVNISNNFLPATTLATQCYGGIFGGCTSLVTVPELPATELATQCYNGMFQGCKKLTTALALPATTLTQHCYRYMFQGCTSLVTAPELPATTLAHYCYYRMFYGCRKLNYIKMLATDISATNCLSDWVVGVASTGTFVKTLAMTTLSTGTGGIPSGWTVVNDGKESGGNLITFTVGSTEHQAEEGMTFQQWVESNYSPTTCYTSYTYVYYTQGYFIHGVNPDTVITEGETYKLFSNATGGDN